MSKSNEFIKAEKDLYGKLYVDITYAIDNISPFLEESNLKLRKYVINMPLLKKYVELINSAEQEINKSGFLNLFNNNKYIDLLQSYKNDHKDNFEQLKKCSSCACLNCSSTCKFDNCIGCKKSSKIASCDHKKINLTLHDNFVLNLTNNNTGESDRYLVLSTLQNVELNQKYIIIENIKTKEKFILYYYPGISEDSYGEITNPEEFDYIASVYQSILK